MAEQKYKWSHPLEWLLDRINDPEAEGELRYIARTLAEKLDGDTIQDLFQSEMDEDGYFTPEDEASSGEDE